MSILQPVRPLTAPEMDLLCITTIRTLSVDAVQQAKSGYPGTPMALAPGPHDLKSCVIDAIVRHGLDCRVYTDRVIGDMPNDVLMFEKSGLSIAMANASPEVQRQAQFVTASNQEEGFAKATEAFAQRFVSIRVR